MKTTRKLIITELKLLVREPLVLAFVFAFPIVTVLVLGGVFGKDDPAFQGVDPAKWYVAGYLAVAIAAIGLIMVPVHLASYRDRGVLRRFAAAGFPRWSFAVAELAVGLIITAVACAALLVTAGAVYGVPSLHDPVLPCVPPRGRRAASPRHDRLHAQRLGRDPPDTRHARHPTALAGPRNGHGRPRHRRRRCSRGVVGVGAKCAPLIAGSGQTR